MRILCFGGTFNPIHHGHLACARQVAETAGYDRVMLIPSAQPPHRAGEVGLANATDRLTMCQLAAQSDPMFDVSDVELRRNTPSYTIETARALRGAGWPDVHWLIGGDTVPHLPAWREADRLMEEVEFVVMARPGWSLDWDALPLPFRRLREKVVPAPLIEISASEIRRRVAAGRSVQFLAPPAVVDYIRDTGLYVADPLPAGSGG